MNGTHEKKYYPTNPLGIIALFVFFIETINATTIYFLKDNPQLLKYIVVFIISFPSVIAFLFFLFLWKKPQAFYTPNDYKEDSSFLNAIFREIKLEQKVLQATLNPPNDPNNVFDLIDDLLAKNELLSIIRIGRSYIKLSEFAKAIDFFKYIKDKFNKKDPLYTRVVANCGYSLVGLKEYHGALKYFEELESMLGERMEVWHMIPQAYCYYMTGNTEAYQSAIEKANYHPKMYLEIEVSKIRHPEIAKDLKIGVKYL